LLARATQELKQATHRSLYLYLSLGAAASKFPSLAPVRELHGVVAPPTLPVNEFRGVPPCDPPPRPLLLLSELPVRSRPPAPTSNLLPLPPSFIPDPPLLPPPPLLTLPVKELRGELLWEPGGVGMGDRHSPVRTDSAMSDARLPCPPIPSPRSLLLRVEDDGECMPLTRWVGGGRDRCCFTPMSSGAGACARAGAGAGADCSGLYGG
jgi:hypothetical protein